MVVALAVALVISRNLTNTGAVPATGASPTGPATAGPGGVPRYYVAVQDGGDRVGREGHRRMGDSPGGG